MRRREAPRRNLADYHPTTANRSNDSWFLSEYGLPDITETYNLTGHQDCESFSKVWTKNEKNNIIVSLRATRDRLIIGSFWSDIGVMMSKDKYLKELR